MNGAPALIVEREIKDRTAVRDRGQGGIAFEPERHYGIGRQRKRSHVSGIDSAPRPLAVAEINGELQGVGALGGGGRERSGGDGRRRAIHVMVKTEERRRIRIAFKVVNFGPHGGRRREFDQRRVTDLQLVNIDGGAKRIGRIWSATLAVKVETELREVVQIRGRRGVPRHLDGARCEVEHLPIGGGRGDR